jgi:hypothetical protein
MQQIWCGYMVYLKKKSIKKINKVGKEKKKDQEWQNKNMSPIVQWFNNYQLHLLTVKTSNSFTNCRINVCIFLAECTRQKGPQQTSLNKNAPKLLYILYDHNY